MGDIQQINISPVMPQLLKSDYFSSTTVDTSENININYSHVLPFHLANNDEFDIFYNITKNTRKSWYNTITEQEKLIIAEDNDDQSIISKIDPDLNILYYINDAIQNSSRYYDTSSFSYTFKNQTYKLSILNANIRGMRTNLDDFKVLLKNLNYTFPIIGVTETWLKPHNVENFYLENSSHEFDIRHKKTGGGVSLFLTRNMIYSRRNDIIFNSEINSVTVDIEKREINGHSNISLILVYRPPNTDCSLFFDDLEINISILSAENRHIFLFGDFNLDTFKSTQFKTNKVDAENFTNILTGFNLFKLIHKPTRIKPPSATLLDNIYTNYPITVDTCKSGILTSDISDHFFVFGIFDNLIPKCSQRYSTRRHYSENNISSFSKSLKKIKWDTIYSTNAQESFTYFHNVFLNLFESSFPESTTKLNYKNRLIWMPKSLITCIERKHSLYKLSIMQPTEYNKSNYKKYRNKLTTLKRDLERKYYSDQLDNNKTDIKIFMEYHEIGNR